MSGARGRNALPVGSASCAAASGIQGTKLGRSVILSGQKPQGSALDQLAAVAALAQSPPPAEQSQSIGQAKAKGTPMEAADGTGAGRTPVDAIDEAIERLHDNPTARTVLEQHRATLVTDSSAQMRNAPGAKAGRTSKRAASSVAAGRGQKTGAAGENRTSSKRPITRTAATNKPGAGAAPLKAARLASAAPPSKKKRTDKASPAEGSWLSQAMAALTGRSASAAAASARPQRVSPPELDRASPVVSKTAPSQRDVPSGRAGKRTRLSSPAEKQATKAKPKRTTTKQTFERVRIML